MWRHEQTGGVSFWGQTAVGRCGLPSASCRVPHMYCTCAAVTSVCPPPVCLMADKKRCARATASSAPTESEASAEGNDTLCKGSGPAEQALARNAHSNQRQVSTDSSAMGHQSMMGAPETQAVPRGRAEQTRCWKATEARRKPAARDVSNGCQARHAKASSGRQRPTPPRADCCAQQKGASEIQEEVNHAA